MDVTCTPTRRRRRTAWTALAALVVATWATVPTAVEGATPRTTSNGDLAFQREAVAGDHTQTDIWTYHPDGSTTRLTKTSNFNEFGPAYDQAGDRIAFWRTPAPFGPGTLMTMTSTGGNKQQLTSDVDARDPSWNPTGTRLVFDVASNDLYTIKVEGGSPVQLTSGRPLDFEPAWSPNGRYVAFTRGSATGDPGNLFVLEIATHTLTKVTRSAAYDHQVAWAPAGHRLVFERDFGDRSSIFTIRTDGTDLRQLTSGPHFDVGPAWSPDATLIAFGSDRSELLGDMWLMRANGSDAHRMFGYSGTAEGFPDWQIGQ